MLYFKYEAECVYFEVETPLGVRIRTTRAYWKKITKVKHPVIAKYEVQVKDSLARPDEIRRTRRDKEEQTGSAGV